MKMLFRSLLVVGAYLLALLFGAVACIVVVAIGTKGMGAESEGFAGILYAMVVGWFMLWFLPFVILAHILCRRFRFHALIPIVSIPLFVCLSRLFVVQSVNSSSLLATVLIGSLGGATCLALAVLLAIALEHQ